MMARLPWFWTRKSFKLIGASLALVLAFGLLYSYNFYQYQKLPQEAGGYLTSTLEWQTVPENVRVGEPVVIGWSISAPTPRSAERTALFWGQVSTPSAQLSDPQQAPYPHRSPDYWQGPFGLSEQFEVTLTPTEAVPLYMRIYARVDGRDLWSQEKKLNVQP